MTEFSWKRDLKFVKWGATILHNLLRAFCAGIVLAILGLVLGVGGASHGAGGGPSRGVALLVPLVWPFVYLIGFLPLGLVSGYLSRLGVPWIGLVSLAASLYVVLGDPLVWLLHKIKPQLVLVEDPGFFQFTIIVFVIDEEKRRVLQAKLA